MPSVNLLSGFNTKEVKKQYKKLAKIYHPDKLRQLSGQEADDAKTKWNSIVRAYETLTEREKFDNWIHFGNPEGSSLARSIDFAMPSFFMDEN